MNTGRYSRVDVYDQDSNLYSSWLPSRELSDWLRLRQSLVTPVTQSPVALRQQMSTSGRRTPESPIHSLNLEQWHSNVTPRWTGIQLGNPPRRESLRRYQQMSESTHTTPSAESQRIIWLRSPWSENVLSSGDGLVQERAEELGTKLDGMHTPKFRVPNSGTAIMDRTMLLSTSSPGKLASSTCYAGAIDTPCPLRRRVRPLSLGPRRYGSPATLTREIGTQTHRSLKRKHSYED